jgi:hypothetical protein
MRLGIKPAAFLGRLVVLFFLTYALWTPVEPVYTHVLTALSRGFLHLTEAFSFDPASRNVTEMRVRETADGRPAIYFQHRRYPQVESGIPAEWVQANLVLLIPLMLATPAASYRQRFGRLGLALVIVVFLQVLDVTVTVKALYARTVPGYGAVARRLYQFGDAFTQGLDTQLFPFAIWAGIHLRQLLGRDRAAGTTAAEVPAAAVPRSRRPGKRRR